MSLDEWVNDQLMRGKAVVSDDWFIEPTNNGVNVAMNLDLPPPNKIIDLLRQIPRKFLPREYHILLTDLGLDPSIPDHILTDEIDALTAQSLGSGVRCLLALNDESSIVKSTRVYFNWFDEGDLCTSTPFSVLRKLCFPWKYESRAMNDVEKFRNNPYGFFIPGLEVGSTINDHFAQKIEGNIYAVFDSVVRSQKVHLESFDPEKYSRIHNYSDNFHKAANFESSLSIPAENGSLYPKIVLEYIKTVHDAIDALIPENVYVRRQLHQ